MRQRCPVAISEIYVYLSYQRSFPSAQVHHLQLIAVYKPAQ